MRFGGTPVVQAEILNLLADLRQQRGLTFLLVTHDLPIVSLLGDLPGAPSRDRLEAVTPVAAFGVRRLASNYGTKLVARSVG